MQSTGQTLWGYVFSYPRKTTLGFLLVAGATLVGLLIPFILRYTIDDLTDGRMTAARLAGYIAIFFGASCLSASLAFGMRRVLLGLSHVVEYDIRRDVFEHLTRLDYGFYHRERTGDIMTKMTSDLGSIRDFVGQGLLQGSRTLIGFALAFSIMFAMNTYMALCVFALLPVVSIVFFLFMRVIRQRYDACQEQFSTISNFAQETFSGIRTLKGFGIEDRQRARFKDLNDEYIRRNMALARIEEPVWPLMALAFGLGVMILLLVGGREVIAGRVSLGEFVQFNQYLVYLQWPMLALGWTTNLLQRGLASWKRLRMILDAQPDIRDGERTDPSLTCLRGAIEFKDVILRQDGRTLLDHIHLAIPEGSTLGITGPTGSGKTLLAMLIARLMDPTEGSVLIDGRDARAYPLSTLRRHIGIAPQEPFLFSDTLANNIAFGLAAAPEPALRAGDDHILWAAEVAHLREDVDLFPEKFETMLGERGVTLSGGQRQRTAISRAIARRPQILILDDIFSAVDTQTEARILARLQPILRGRTSIIISHRVSTLRHADAIIVLERGRITQHGRHEQLVASPGYYRDLDEMQRLEARLEAG